MIKVTKYNKGRLESIMEWDLRVLTVTYYNCEGKEDLKIVVEGCQNIVEARAMINR